MTKHRFACTAFACLAAAALLATPAPAADVAPAAKPALTLPNPALPLPAPAFAAVQQNDCVQASCSGPYLGANLINDGANFDVIGSGLQGLASNGMMFGAQAGYQFWNGQWFAAIEGDAELTLSLNAPSNTGVGFHNSYLLAGQVKIGYSLAQLFGGATTGTAAPSLPAQLQNALMSPYIAVGICDRPWGAGFCTGAGVQALLAQNWTLDAEYLHVNYNNAAVDSNTTEQTENLFLIGVSRHFGFGD